MGIELRSACKLNCILRHYTTITYKLGHLLSYKRQGKKWCKVCVYALMSIGRAERRVGTTERIVGRLLNDNKGTWDEALMGQGSEAGGVSVSVLPNGQETLSILAYVSNDNTAG